MNPASLPAIVARIGRWNVWLVIVTLVAFALRLFRLADHRLWYDEAYVGAAVLNTVPHLWLEFPKIEPHPPLFFLTELLAVQLLGLDAFSLRIGPAFAGSLLVPVAGVVLRRFTGPTAALVAAIGVAVNPMLVSFAQEARMYTLLALQFAASFYALDRAVRTTDQSDSSRWMLFALGTELAAVFTHYTAILVFPAAHLLLLCVYWRSRRISIVHWVVGQLAILATWLPWFMYWAALFGTRDREPNRLLGTHRLFSQFATGPANSFDAFPLEWPTLGGIFLLCAGSVMAFRASIRGVHMRPLLVWAGLGCAEMAGLTFAGFPREKFVLYVIPAFIGLISVSITAGGRWRSVITGLVLLWIATAAWLGLSPYYDTQMYAKWFGYENARAMLSGRIETTDVLVEADLDPSFRFVLGMPAPYDAVVLPHGIGKPDQVLYKGLHAELRGYGGTENWVPDYDALASDIRGLAENHSSLWLILKPTTEWWDKRGLVRQEFENTFWARERLVVGDARVTRYMTPLGVDREFPVADPNDFGDARLLGSGCVIRPDGTGDVALVWLPKRHTARPLTVFVHALGSGQLVSQHDGEPSLGRLSTTEWTVGQPVLDVHPLTQFNKVDSLAIGLYDPTTMQREAIGVSDSILLALPCAPA
jgi:hypothetical protein